MPEQPKSRLDRELDEILARKAEDKPREPIQFSSHPRAPKTKGAKLIQDVKKHVGPGWNAFTSVAILFALALAILARMVSDFSPLLALILSAWAIGAIWWPGIKRLMGPRDAGEPDVKYWRGRAYTSQIKEVASRHPVDTIKRYFDRRR